MERATVIAAIRQQEGALRRLGVKSLTLFGSVGRAEHGASSDVDLLYEFEEGQATLDRLMELQALLEGVLGRPVDLVAKKYVSPILERHIRGDLETVL